MKHCKYMYLVYNKPRRDGYTVVLKYVLVMVNDTYVMEMNVLRLYSGGTVID